MARVFAQAALNYVDYTVNPPTVDINLTYFEPTQGYGNLNSTANSGLTGALTTVNLRAQSLADINTARGTSYITTDFQCNDLFV